MHVVLTEFDEDIEAFLELVSFFCRELIVDGAEFFNEVLRWIRGVGMRNPCPWKEFVLWPVISISRFNYEFSIVPVL